MKKDFCGPFWMHKSLRRLLSSHFNASCKIHDLDYKTKRYNRKEADKRFLEHMKRQSKGPLSYSVALLYYSLVRIGGKISWRKDGN